MLIISRVQLTSLKIAIDLVIIVAQTWRKRLNGQNLVIMPARIQLVAIFELDIMILLSFAIILYDILSHRLAWLLPQLLINLFYSKAFMCPPRIFNKNNYLLPVAAW